MVWFPRRKRCTCARIVLCQLLGVLYPVDDLKTNKHGLKATCILCLQVSGLLLVLWIRLSLNRMLVPCLVHTKLAKAFSKLQPPIWLIGFTQFPGVLGVHRFISKPENIVFTRSHAVRMSSFEEDLEAGFEKVWSTEYLNKFTCTASHCLRCINWQHVRSHQLCFVLRVTLNYGKLFNTLFRVNIPKWVVVGLNNLRCGLHFMLYQSS